MNIRVSASHEKDSVAIRDVFASTMVKMAEADPRVLLLDADLMSSIGTKTFQAKFPERMINCGIAEANMIGISCGLSVVGFVPFAHSFGVFASRRAYDQTFVSGGFANANVKIVGSDPGVTAAYNGGTHMPFEDMGIMRNIPKMTVLEITDCAMMANLLPKIKEFYGMCYMRTPRKLSYQIYEEGSDFEIGKAAKLKEGTDASIFAIGYCVNEGLKAAELLQKEGISAAVYDMFTLKPIDADAVIEAAKKTGAIVTAENHNVINGLGSAVAEVLGENCPAVLQRVGVKESFGEVGTIEYLAERFEITAPFIVKAVKQAVARKQG